MLHEAGFDLGGNIRTTEPALAIAAKQKHQARSNVTAVICAA